MNFVKITAYNTHIEIYPYSKGDCPSLEKMLSYFDNIYYTNIEVGFYIENDILYIPRGINLTILQNMFGVMPSIVYNTVKQSGLNNVMMKAEPRGKIQNEAIDFLLSRNRFESNMRKSQFGLNLDTGDGKTYTMINAIVQSKSNAIIIVHKSRLKTQWKEEFIKMSTIDENDIIDISGTSQMNSIKNKEIKGSIYIINHQTIEAYARKYGWDTVKDFFNIINVGIKVFDEAHKFFRDILMIDFFSNTPKTYYLTATFGRADVKEYGIYKRAFTNVVRFGEETYNYEEKRKHINMVVIYFNSHPDSLVSVSTGYGFSNYKYIDYALKNDENHTILKVLDRILEQTSNLQGKRLITSPKIDSVDFIANYIESNYDKEVGCIYSKNTREENDDIIKNKDIISSTIKSTGEGDNIKGLRILINLDPIGSRNTADQLRGRLREYSKTDDTFLFYPVDLGFPECNILFKRILPAMKKKCKSIKIMKWMDL